MNLFLFLSLSASLLIAGTSTIAKDFVYRGFGLEFSGVANDPAQFGVAAHGSAELHVDERFGLQGDVGFEYLTTEDDTQPAALIAVHPFIRLGYGVSLGAYFQGRGSSDPATAAGLELAWKNRGGATAELYFGTTWGDELEDDGHASSKGATLGYTFGNDLYATLFFNKDTTSETGRADRDYYDYGLGAEIPLGAAGDTRLALSVGEIRFDAEGGPETKLTIGLTRTFGGAQTRPTFTRQRSVLTGLAGF